VRRVTTSPDGILHLRSITLRSYTARLHVVLVEAVASSG
jgi:hypothetical protein